MYNQGKESDLSFDFIFKNLPASIWWSDRNHIYQGCNLENCRITGINSPDDFIGQDIFKIARTLNWPHSIPQEIHDLDEFVMQTGTPKTDVHNVVPQNNKNLTIYQVSTHSPIFDKNGQVIGLIGIGISSAELSNQPKIIAP